MTHIRYAEDRKKRTVSLTADGHAGYAPSGQDIVCAGISALCVCLLIRFGGKSESGHTEITYTASTDAEYGEVIGIFRTIVTGLRWMAATYPQYVDIYDSPP